MGVPLAALAINQQQPGPLDQASKALQLKALAQNQQYQAQAQPLELQQRQQQVQQGQLQLADQQAMTKALQAWDGKDVEELPGMVLKHGGSAQAVFGLKNQIVEQRKNLASADEATLKNQATRNDMIAGHIEAMKGADDKEGAYQNMVNDLTQKGLVKPGQLPQQYPGDDQLALIEKGMVGQKQLVSEAQKEREVAAQEMAAQARKTTAEKEKIQQPTEAGLAAQATGGGPGAAAADAALKRLDQSKLASRPVVNVMTANDAKDIADAIQSGDQPPTLQGLYRNAGPVRAELARRGVPLAAMETDWKATQKYISSLNSTQQVKLQQSISSASELLPKIDGIYNEWKKLAPVSGFKIANHAALVAMKNMPGRAGAVASALDTQIAELTADLGNIYMGGNSPTDQALKLGHQALQSDWGPEAFEEGLKQAKLNIGIRQNSMKHGGGPAGLSGTTNYAPGAGGGAGAPAAAPAQAGGKIRARDPQGKLHEAPAGTPLPAGWKAE